MDALKRNDIELAVKFSWLQRKHNWPGCKYVGYLESIIENFRSKEKTKESSYYFTLLPLEVIDFADAVYRYWSIKNKLLDVVFKKDQYMVRKEQDVENFALIRHIAINLGFTKVRVALGITVKELVGIIMYLNKILSAAGFSMQRLCG